MADSIQLPAGAPREQAYQSLIPQIEALMAGEPSLIANLANTAAALKEAFDFWWVGFYLVEGDELVLGPFQGPVACTRIGRGKGVCGSAWAEARTLVVEDVDQFPGHIACSSASRSEIVVPILYDDEVVGVLDVDSDRLADFSEVDDRALNRITALLSPMFRN